MVYPRGGLSVRKHDVLYQPVAAVEHFVRGDKRIERRDPRHRREGAGREMTAAWTCARPFDLELGVAGGADGDVRRMERGPNRKLNHQAGQGRRLGIRVSRVLVEDVQSQAGVGGGSVCREAQRKVLAYARLGRSGKRSSESNHDHGGEL